MYFFNYTRAERDLDSSFVKDFYYNDETKYLLVTLDESLGNPRHYLYENVDADYLDEWLDADSLGRFYNQEIKRVYGPAVEVFDPVTTDVSRQEEPFPPPSPVYAMSVNSAEVVSVPRIEGGLNPHTAPETFEYELTWSFEGGVFPFTTKATSDAEAVEALRVVLKQLNLEAKINEVLRVVNETVSPDTYLMSNV